MKNLFPCRIVSVALAALLPVLAFCGDLSPVWAQPAPNIPTVEEPAETPLDIDPQAKLALEALMARYQKLSSYSDVMTVQTNGGAIEWAQSSWERPNKALVMRKKDGQVVARAVSDGTTFWAYSPEHPGYYLQRPAEAKRIFETFHETDTGGPGLAFILGGSTIDELFQKDLRVLRFQGEETIDNVPCRLVTVKVDGAEGGTSVVTCYIGVEDGLLHQLSADYNGRQRGTKLVEKHTDIRLNPTLGADLWKFTPPAGLKPIDYYSKLEPHRFDPLYKVGDILPPFEALTLDGKKLNLADYGDENKVVILDFFSITMGAFGVKQTKEWLAKYQEQGLAVIGISMDGRRSAVEQFVKENNVTYPVVFDGLAWQNAVAVKYGVRSLPTAFIVGRDGRLKTTKSFLHDFRFGEILEAALQTTK